MDWKRNAPLWPVAASRILIGLMWLFSLRWKLPPDFAPASGKGLMDWLHLETQYAAFPIYGTFVESIVIPNFEVFAWILFLSELFVGVSLLTGCLTRLGALGGLLLAVNLGIGLLDVPGEWPWSYAMLAMWHGTFLVMGAGRLFGVDGWLRRRLPADSRWRWLTVLA